MSAEPLSREEQENIEWALSCSNGGLDADGVRAYMAPWIATVNDLRATLQREEEARKAAQARAERLEVALREARPYVTVGWGAPGVLDRIDAALAPEQEAALAPEQEAALRELLRDAGVTLGGACWHIRIWADQSICGKKIYAPQVPEKANAWRLCRLCERQKPKTAKRIAALLEQAP